MEGYCHSTRHGDIHTIDDGLEKMATDELSRVIFFVFAIWKEQRTSHIRDWCLCFFRILSGTFRTALVQLMQNGTLLPHTPLQELQPPTTDNNIHPLVSSIQ